MAIIGRACLILALAASVYGVGASVYGATTRRREFIDSGRRAVYAVAALSTLAFAILIGAFLSSDFHYVTVVGHSSLTTPTFYRAAAAWSSQEGSLLLWLWLLSLWSSLVLFLTRHRLRDIAPWATAVLMGFSAFFSGLLIFGAQPFVTTANAPADGIGLSPLLRYPAMMIHPPMLYSGYTLATIPFAFAIGALIVRRTGPEWIAATRRFALASWFFLGIGIILGARWSYAELDWGGYWGWDAVENASLLPWLTGTAFLHSIMIQEKRGMLKVWNASLVLLTGILAVMGTFLVRSGILSSIHAFVGSNVGTPFVVLLAVMIAGSVLLVVTRRDALRSEHHLDSLVSRESVFLLNNLVLVSIALVVWWGTFFPLISEAITGSKASVGPPFFDEFVRPLAIVLVLLTGIGPVIAWRRTTLAGLRRTFAIPVGAGLLVPLVLLPFGVGGKPFALVFFGVAAFAVTVAGQEFWRGFAARRAMAGEAPPLALLSMIRRNRRRYGGYIVHLGIALLFVGVAASSAFEHAHDATLQRGQSVHVGKYTFKYVRPTARVKLGASRRVERLEFGAVVDVYQGRKKLETLTPYRGYYPITASAAPFVGPTARFFDGENVSSVGLDAGLRRDIWGAVQPNLNSVQRDVTRLDDAFAKAAGKLSPQQLTNEFFSGVLALVHEYATSAPPAQFRFIVSPLVTWIWIGALVVFGGGLIVVWPAPDALRRRATAGLAARVARDLGRA